MRDFKLTSVRVEVKYKLLSHRTRAQLYELASQRFIKKRIIFSDIIFAKLYEVMLYFLITKPFVMY